MPTAYQQVITTRNNLINILLEDSLNPSPSYSVGSQSVDRNSWRESLNSQIVALNKLASTLNPVEFRQQIY